MTNPYTLDDLKTRFEIIRRVGNMAPNIHNEALAARVFDPDDWFTEYKTLNLQFIIENQFTSFWIEPDEETGWSGIDKIPDLEAKVETCGKIAFDRAIEQLHISDEVVSELGLVIRFQETLSYDGPGKEFPSIRPIHVILDRNVLEFNLEELNIVLTILVLTGFELVAELLNYTMSGLPKPKLLN